MAGFTLKFDAQTSGNYKIAYKDADDPCAVYRYKEVYVNNQSYPHEVSVNIEIDGSLYCDNITYEGWVLPMCFGEVYQPGQDVPDHATSFTHVISQLSNSCEKINIKLKGFPILRFEILDGGSGYTDSTTLAIQRDPNDTNIEDACSIYPVLDSNGTIIAVSYTNTCNPLDIGGCYDPNYPPKILLNGVETPDIQAVLNNGGFEIDGNAIEVFACDNVVNKHGVTLANVGDEVNICGDISVATGYIPNHYDVQSDGCCLCESCSDATIDATSSTTGSVWYCYNKCWDDGGVTMYFAELLNGQTVSLSNIIFDTLGFYSSTLDVDPVVTQS